MLTLDHLHSLLQQYANHTGHSVDLLLIGGLAMLATVIPPVPRSMWMANSETMYGLWQTS